MKVLVVSGFLGAGKTTFIKKMIEMTGLSFMILENDYGSVGTDAEILSRANGADEPEIKVWEMLEGCICCSVQADFATSVLTIANTVDPDYLIVEPTGVGSLRSIMQNIKRVAYERIEILPPVTLLDVGCFDADRLAYPELLTDQLIHAEQILFTKTEETSYSDIERICTVLKDIGVKGKIVTEHYSKKDRIWWESLLCAEGNPKDNAVTEELLSEALLSGAFGAAKQTAEKPVFESIGFKEVRLSNVGELVMIMQKTILGSYGLIRRAKGCVSINGGAVRFDVVDKRYTIYGAEEADDSNVVFIGKAVDRFLLAEAFSKLNQPLMKA